MRSISRIVAGFLTLVVADRRRDDSPRRGAAGRHHSPRAQPSARQRPRVPAGRSAGGRGAGAVEPGRLRQEPAMAHRARQGALLGHAGRQRRRAGLRELPLPRRRRSAIEEPGEPGLEAVPVADLTYSTGTVRTIQLEAVGLSADPARQPGRPRRSRSGHRQQRRRVFAGHSSSRR